MVKALAFFKRKAGMPVDESQAYWLTRHPDAVTHLAGLRRYVQSHTPPTAYHKGEPVYDGIAAVWFDDTHAMHALRGTPAMDAVVADEARFINRSTMGASVTALGARDFTFRGRAYARQIPLFKDSGGILALKTGFTDEAGYNLAAAARARDARILVVVLGARTRASSFADARTLLRYGVERTRV
jgi:uncharacterized protein (TIGR02118 family)